MKNSMVYVRNKGLGSYFMRTKKFLCALLIVLVFISSSSGSTSLLDMKIYSTPNTYSLGNYLFRVSAGQLTCADSTISSLNSSSTPLVNITTGSASFSNVTFLDITRASGNGAVFEITKTAYTVRVTPSSAKNGTATS